MNTCVYFIAFSHPSKSTKGLSPKAWVKGDSESDVLEGIGVVLTVIGAVILAVCLIAGCLIGCTLANAHTIDEQIALYEQENQIIEGKIEASVNAYLEHEQKTIQHLTPENATTYVSFIPELNSDSVVNQQIKTYLENHQIIISLKVEKINLVKCKWWLYFGG